MTTAHERAEMVHEPFFVVQTSEPKSFEERQAFFREQAAAARAFGAKWVRCSQGGSDLEVLLVEGWRERPATEGPQRWSLQEKP